MADLELYRYAPDNDLDCLYVAAAEGSNPLDGLALSGPYGKAVAKVISELGVRGTRRRSRRSSR